jgi:hypothetical protein
MGEQGSYRPPGGQAGSGQASLDALEAAFGGGGQGPGHGDGPEHDGAHARPPAVTPPATSRPKPTWPAVIATTAGLWLERRGNAPGRRLRRRWTIAVAGLAVAAVVAGGLAIALHRQHGTAPAGTAAAGHAAAMWVSGQVSRDAIVGCDPQMCQALREQGFPAGDLLVLRPGAAGLRFCDVIVATQTVRNLLGSHLQQETAPAIIAGFGSGRARIEVRAVAPGGAAAYRSALAADWAARRMAATQLVKSPRIHAGATAREELLSGKVDSRLLITLAELAVSQPVDVVAFGDSAPAASAGMPLREMEVSGTGSPMSRTTELQRIRTLVLAQHAVFLPAHVSLVRLAGGGTALRIEFGAPSPLGLLIGRPVTQ